MIASAEASNSTYVPVPPRSPKTRPKKSQSLAQIFAIQRALFGDATSPDTKPSDKAQLARAWDALEGRKREIQMKPKPKPVDVQALADQKRKRDKPTKGFTETATDTTRPAAPTEPKP